MFLILLAIVAYLVWKNPNGRATVEALFESLSEQAKKFWSQVEANKPTNLQK
jgi:hypothetical protein